jgi:hypothetical protein
MSLKNRIIGLAAVGAAALAVAAPLASAKTASTTLTKVASPCDAQYHTQAFLPFGDANLYGLAPQGSFEGGAVGAWTIAGSAEVVADAGYPDGPAADTASLELAAGSKATSPPICANASTPTFRFFTKALTAGAGVYGVDVSYPSSTGGTAHGAASLTPATSWAPTPQIRVKTNKIAVDASGWGYIQVTITAPSNSALRIDDLYLDPRMH